MPTLDFEKDPQLITLTDALRAGPGSAQWRDAVSRLRAQGGDQADEYLLLCTAREHLASGRSFREIHAGPGFSRKVMDAVEQEGAAKPPRVAPTAGLIALLSAVVIIAVVGSVGYVLWRDSGTTAPPRQDLGSILFVDGVLDVRFTAAPEGWRSIGALPLRFDNGLRPGEAPAGAGDDAAVGGALLWGQAIAPAQAAQVEVTLRLPQPASKLVAQVFITDDPVLNDSRATSPHELAWTYRDGQASVALPTGRVEAAVWKPGAKQERVEVRVQFDGRSVAIDTAGRPAFAGGHGLDPQKPRYVGVRFLAPAGEKADPNAAFVSMRVRKPRAP